MTKGDGKPCKKCGTREWYKGGACKECHRHTLRKWINNNREKHKENFRVWADSNHEYNLERGRKWKEENLERTRQTAREWRNRNIDRARERDKQWAKDNPDKAAAKQRNRRTKIKGGGGSHTAAEFKQLCEQYKNRCLCCGRDDVSLTFDHVVPVNMGGSSDISNGQPLCQSCNSRKGNRYIDYRTKPGLLGWIQKRLFE